MEAGCAEPRVLFQEYGSLSRKQQEAISGRMDGDVIKFLFFKRYDWLMCGKWTKDGQVGKDF